jgi:hypothetical protein
VGGILEDLADQALDRAQCRFVLFQQGFVVIDDEILFQPAHFQELDVDLVGVLPEFVDRFNVAAGALVDRRDLPVGSAQGRKADD